MVSSGKLLITGVASETGGRASRDPRGDGQPGWRHPPIDADLTPPPHPQPGAVGFSASIHTGGNGQFRFRLKLPMNSADQSQPAKNVMLSGGAVLLVQNLT